MTSVCFDTDFLVAFMRGDAAATKKMEELARAGVSQASTTSISALEMYIGAHRSDRPDEVEKVKELLGLLSVTVFDHNSAAIAGRISAQLRSNPIDQADLLIASIAIANNQVLLTKNAKYFERVPGLKVERW